MDYLKNILRLKLVVFHSNLKIVKNAKRYFTPKVGLSLLMRHTHKI
jgi:hypothetical protein